MISPISFGSTYKAYAISNNSDIKQQAGYKKLLDYCQDNQLPYESKINIANSSMHEIPTHILTLTVEAPDEHDKEIEAFCANKGIKIEKYGTQELMEPKSIQRRIKNPPMGYRKAMVDVDKLTQLLEKQDNNFDHCESDYEKYYKEKTNFMLKSADMISAPSLYINSKIGKKQMLEYIDSYGVKNLNDDSLIIDLSQRTLDPEHCLYFAMKDAGLKQIPVYVNKDTYELGKALGLMKLV